MTPKRVQNFSWELWIIALRKATLRKNIQKQLETFRKHLRKQEIVWGPLLNSAWGNSIARLGFFPIPSTLASEEPLKKAMSFLPITWHGFGAFLQPWLTFERMPLIQHLGGTPGNSWLCLSAKITQDATVWSGAFTDTVNCECPWTCFLPLWKHAYCSKEFQGSHWIRNSVSHCLCLQGYICFMLT